ncbi:MAG: hypothetical protein QMC77_05080 [Methanocellales archaeon]|nr:hypothetical protein [Methanocellales archaeon]
MKPKTYEVVKSSNIWNSCCSVCNELKLCVKVRNLKTGQFEWRCGRHVRKEFRYEIADRNIEKMKRMLKKLKGSGS